MSDNIVRKPKVLVIASTPFSTTKNNGKTLSSFFENYGKSVLAQFSFSGGDCNKEICDSYYFLTKENVLHKEKGAEFTADAIAAKTETVHTGKVSLLQRVFHIFSLKRLPIAVYLKNMIWSKADYSSAFEWIAEFSPDIVFFQGFSMAYGYDFALQVCEKWNLPLILELTDDYTYRLYPGSLLEKWNHGQYMRLFRKALNMASKVVVISDAMKKEYGALYGGDMEVMMNSVSIPVVDASGVQRRKKDYVYAGNLLLNRWKVLRNLGIALMRADAEATLTIYTPDVPPKRILDALLRVKSIQYGGRLSKEELEDRLQKCSVVVHVEAFDRRNRKITRLSMSTKISEYAACGARILAIGPEDVASMKSLKENRLALCIHDFGKNEICNALQTMDFPENQREQAKIFLERCASDSSHRRLQEWILDAAIRGK